jgi:uncharacterized protein YrrD
MAFGGARDSGSGRAVGGGSGAAKSWWCSRDAPASAEETAMTELVRAGDLIGRPVVTLDGGDDIAEVKDVVYDSEARRLVGFTLNKRGWFRGSIKELLPAESVQAIGDTAVMIRDEAALTPPKDAPTDLAGAPSSRNVLGDRVITESGVDLGEVSGLVMMLGDQVDVVGYELQEESGGRKFIPIDAQTAVSGQSLVVPANIADFTRHDLSDFGAAVEQYRTAHGGGK